MIGIQISVRIFVQFLSDKNMTLHEDPQSNDRDTVRIDEESKL